jgi:uncharacterized protein
MEGADRLFLQHINTVHRTANVRREAGRLVGYRRRALDESESRREDHWFRENEKQLLEAARIAREKREAERSAQGQAAARETLRQQHFMKCPKCGHDLAEEDLEGVKVDRCSDCEGVYFDAGELERVLLKKEEDRKGFFRRLVKL